MSARGRFSRALRIYFLGEQRVSRATWVSRVSRSSRVGVGKVLGLLTV